MEHRWGERVAVRMTVELSWSSAPPVTGALQNVSSSGAFVRTQGRGPPRGPIEVILQRQDSSGRVRSARLAAYVVREGESGVGIEWCEFAPRVVREFMIRDRGLGSARSRARVLRAVTRSAEEANTMAAPCAQAAGEPPAIGASH